MQAKDSIYLREDVMKVSFARCLLSALVLAGASHANAQLLNISSGGWQSQNSPAIACTIVGTAGSSWRGMKALVVLAEANSAGSNPFLVAELLENGETMANDTWTGPYMANGAVKAPLPATTYPSLLRAPYGPNDAALLITVPLGWRLCVRSTEVSGGDTLRRVALSVTDVTDGLIRLVGKSTDHPAAVKAIPADTPNLMGTFARWAGTP